MKFKEYAQNVDNSQLESIYEKAKISVAIVNLYNPKILQNISTIANLASGAYGLYSSGENQDIVPPDIEQAMVVKSQGKLNKNQLHQMKPDIIKQYFPEIDLRRINPSDTIHVNVRRIVNELKDDYKIILQIASTIVPEATHDIEHRTTGSTGEGRPEAEERKFMNWALKNPQVQQLIQNNLNRL